MALEYKFTSITSTGGETIALPATGVICIVGGNNVGKSQLLRELRQLVYERDDASSFRVVAGATATDLSADEAESLAWLEERATEYDTMPGQPRRFAFRISEPGTTVDEFRFWLDKHQTYLGNIAPFFVEYAPAGTLAKYAEGYIESDLRRPSNFALLKLRGDGELEEELSNLSVEAFGTALLFDRLDTQPRLRVGSVLEEPPPVNRPTRSYARAVAALDTLDGQGDGMRSFVGLASQVITHRMDVLLVDEPEAFLHPGQARILGRWLSREAQRRGMQVIVSTHDRDFVVGILSARSGEGTTLIRLTRDGPASHFAKLSADEIVELWASPVLRYSNVLQGLFHGRVVVCEADSDCRFYSAALDHRAELIGKKSIADDILLVPTGGKGQLAVMVTALSKLGVETWTVPDFDLLASKGDTKKVLVSLGGTWTPRHEELYIEFATAANRVGWPVVKASGLDGLGGGRGVVAGKELLTMLSAERLHLVPTGEIESFNRASLKTKSEWVTEALELNVHQSNPVAQFISPILG